MLFELAPTCHTQKDYKKVEALYVVVSRKSSSVQINPEEIIYHRNSLN